MVTAASPLKLNIMEAVGTRELLIFYRFFEIPDPRATGERWLAHATQLDLKGTFIVAGEGTNSALAGPAPVLDEFIESLRGDFDWSVATVKRLPLDAGESPYRRLKLKIKPEICTFRHDSNHDLNDGRFVSPAEFHAAAADPNTVFLDVRNNYEARIGTFRGARVIDMEHFPEMPDHMAELEDLKGKRVIGFCTGGIRCEKAIPYLREQGFDAYELEGGILKYLMEYPDGLWEGECFVFEDRYSLTGDLRKGSYDPCPNCGQPSKDGACVACGGEVAS